MEDQTKDVHFTAYLFVVGTHALPPRRRVECSILIAHVRLSVLIRLLRPVPEEFPKECGHRANGVLCLNDFPVLHHRFSCLASSKDNIGLQLHLAHVRHAAQLPLKSRGE